RLLSIFQSPASVQFPPPGRGWYTAHNPEVRGSLALVAWYGDGAPVVDISDPTAPRLVTAYRPPPLPNPQHASFPDGTNVWGVSLLGDLVLPSDTNSGLSVLRLQTNG